MECIEPNLIDCVNIRKRSKQPTNHSCTELSETPVFPCEYREVFKTKFKFGFIKVSLVMFLFNFAFVKANFFIFGRTLRNFFCFCFFFLRPSDGNFWTSSSIFDQSTSPANTKYPVFGNNLRKSAFCRR